MGVLQRFERKLEGLVEGGFARVFRSHVQPVEIAAALQREAADKRAVVGRGSVLVPNEYVVELGPDDTERIGQYDAALRKELAAMVEEHATEQGWSFVGRVAVQFELDEAVNPGIFRVRSRAVASHDGLAARPVSPERAATRPRLVLRTGEGERVVPLDARVTTIGRGAEADVRLSDTGVSRLHAEVRVEPGSIVVADLGSTNGTRVNGRPVKSAPLSDGDVVEMGGSRLVFRDPSTGSDA